MEEEEEEEEEEEGNFRVGFLFVSLFLFWNRMLTDPTCFDSQCSNYDGDDFNEDDSDENGHRRRLLAGGNDDECFEEGKEPLVSATTLHEVLHRANFGARLPPPPPQKKKVF